MRFLYLTLFLVMATFANTQEVYSSTYFSQVDSTTKNIKIEFLEYSMCHITVISNGVIELDAKHRYIVKGRWVMIKNLSTGVWLPLEYEKLDNMSFKLKVFESDSSKYWRTFYKH